MLDKFSARAEELKVHLLGDDWLDRLNSVDHNSRAILEEWAALGRSQDLNSIEGILERILGYIRVMSLSNRPVGMIRLNKIFGATLRALSQGKITCKDLCRELLAEGKIILINSDNSKLAYPLDRYKALLNVYQSEGKTEITLENDLIAVRIK